MAVDLSNVSIARTTVAANDKISESKPQVNSRIPDIGLKKDTFEKQSENVNGDDIKVTAKLGSKHKGDVSTDQIKELEKERKGYNDIVISRQKDLKNLDPNAEDYATRQAEILNDIDTYTAKIAEINDKIDAFKKDLPDAPEPWKPSDLIDLLKPMLEFGSEILKKIL